MSLEFLTVKEFAQRLKIQPRQVYEWINNGRIHALRISDGPKSPYRIPIRELSRLDSECYLNMEENDESL